MPFIHVYNDNLIYYYLFKFFRLWLFTVNCSESKHEAVIKFVVPWRNEGGSKLMR